MVCRNKGRAEAAKDDIVERSQNQVKRRVFKNIHAYIITGFIFITFEWCIVYLVHLVKN